MAAPHKPGTAIAAIVAVGFGLLLSPLSRRYPLFWWFTALFPSSIGLIPALTPHPSAFTSKQLQTIDLRGQSAFVTGANSGIGFETAKALSRQGASVTMACRNPQRCFTAVDMIRKDDGYSGAPIAPLIMDVSDLKSVARAAKTYLKHNSNSLDILYLNAGMFGEPANGKEQLPISNDGIEKVFATNVVGHHLLYRLLKPALHNSTMARVVSTSSVASIWWLPRATSSLIPATLDQLNEGKPSSKQSFLLYGRSKLAQVAWSKAATRRLDDESNIYVNTVHPGGVTTPLLAHNVEAVKLPQMLQDSVLGFLQSFLWTAEEGALTGLYLGVATDEIRSKKLRGKYFHPVAFDFDHPHAGDTELQENVWKLCDKLVESFL